MPRRYRIYELPTTRSSGHKLRSELRIRLWRFHTNTTKAATAKTAINGMMTQTNGWVDMSVVSLGVDMMKDVC